MKGRGEDKKIKKYKQRGLDCVFPVLRGGGFEEGEKES